MSELVNSPVFERFFTGDLAGEFPIAVLNDADQQLIDAKAKTVLLSRDSIDPHVASHPDIGVEDYRRAQQILDHGIVFKKGDTHLIYQTIDGTRYRAVLKRTGDFEKNYLLTLFINRTGKPPKDAKKIR